MRLLLIALIGFMTLSGAFAFDPGPVPGLTLKNALLYALTLGLLLRFSMDKDFRIELPGIAVTFSTLIVYAIFSYLAVILIIRYPHYDVVRNGLNLKGFVDQLLFFLVFFYGIRSNKDAVFLLKCLLLAWTLSHVVAVLGATGVMQFGDVELRSDGRVQGVVGESNQYGAYAVLSLPAMIAVALWARGMSRVFWWAAAGIAAIALLMTVSRGAFVAVVVATISGMLMFRRHLPAQRLAVMALGAFLATVLLVSLAAVLGYGDLLYERLIAGTNSSDMITTSSGRTQIWSNALERMFETPLSLLTGFGWRAYWSMPFRFSPHNYYLNQWFNLGLVGLTCSVILFVLPVRAARAAVDRIGGEYRAILISFIVATIAFATATFFVDLYAPWLDFWAYTGIVMRIAMNAGRQTEASVVKAPGQALTDAVGEAPPGLGGLGPSPAPATHRRDPYGWTVAAGPGR